jgi:PDZ domain-containing protein
MGMSYFNSEKPRPRFSRWGVISLFALALAGLSFLPSGYVIERPGQVFNVMGEIDGKEVISSSDLESYQSESRFDITTVSLLGNREANPNWIQVLAAWADPNQLVLPIDQVFPPNLSTAEVRAESTFQMEVSQQDAIAVALKQMGYQVPRSLYVNSVIEDTPASKKLVAGDFVISAQGAAISTFEELKAAIQTTGAAELLLGVVRDGVEQEIAITPAKQEDSFVIGAMLGYTYDFPATILLQLGDVGGPSGGLMFTLGILDSFTPDSLAGKNHVAGTGTISSEGQVGPIGGIRLKVIAARDAGATIFLAPSQNCEELIGHVPSGLSVAVVRDLAEALKVLDQVAAGTSLPELKCSN